MNERSLSDESTLRQAELRARHLEVYGHLRLPALTIHELEPRLWTGRQPLTALDAHQLAERGVTHVLDLREEREWKDPGRHGADAVAELAVAGIERLSLPIQDGAEPDPATLDLAVEFLRRAVDSSSHSRVYVHCRAGIERTGTVVLAFRASRDGQPLDRVHAELTTPEHPYSPLPWQVESVRRWLSARRRETGPGDPRGGTA